MEPTMWQHVTLDPEAAAAVGRKKEAQETWTVEFIRPTKQDVTLVNTEDAREGRAVMRRIDRVPFSALRPAKEA